MNKEDAKFLIDQFNKYASWFTGQPIQFLFSFSALFLAGTALVVSILNPYLRELFGYSVMEGLPILVTLTFPGAFLFCFSVIYGLWVFYDFYFNKWKLSLLMDHLASCGSLPDGLTFENIIRFKPPRLEEFLRTNLDKRVRKDYR